MSQEPQAGPSGGDFEMRYVHRKGGTILLRAGYQFTKKETYKSGVAVWECYLRKKTKCHGKIQIKVSILNTIISIY